MVYIIADKERPSKVLLVKAETREALDERIKLKDGEKVIGSLTTSEIRTLDSPSFGVVST